MKKGFTLIDVIIATIIAVLAGIIFSQYGKYVKKSKVTDGIVIMREIAHGEALYKASKGIYLHFAPGTQADKIKIDLNISFVTLDNNFNRFEVQLCQGATKGIIISAWNLLNNVKGDKVYYIYPKNITLSNNYDKTKLKDGVVYVDEYLDSSNSKNSAPECPIVRR